ncbi:MAG TPA: pyrroloquinoline quinone biosynthesis peptide chaperone PqqD [Gemmatimonadales bacterium]
MNRPGPVVVPRIAPKARLQRDEVRDREVLLYPEGLVALNETGSAILNLCDGTRSVAEIVQTLKQRYGAEGIERDVTAFLDGLAAKGLVTFAPPSYPPTPSDPRR